MEDAPVIDLEEEAPSVDEAEESPFVAQVMRDVEAMENISALMNVTPKQPMKNFS